MAFEWIPQEIKIVTTAVHGRKAELRAIARNRNLVDLRNGIRDRMRIGTIRIRFINVVDPVQVADIKKLVLLREDGIILVGVFRSCYAGDRVRGKVITVNIAVRALDIHRAWVGDRVLTGYEVSFA